MLTKDRPFGAVAPMHIFLFMPLPAVHIRVYDDNEGLHCASLSSPMRKYHTNLLVVWMQVQ